MSDNLIEQARVESVSFNTTDKGRTLFAKLADELARLTAEGEELRAHLKDAHAAVNDWIKAEQAARAKVLAWEDAAMGIIAMDDSRLSPIEVKLKRMLPASLPAKPSGPDLRECAHVPSDPFTVEGELGTFAGCRKCGAVFAFDAKPEGQGEGDGG